MKTQTNFILNDLIKVFFLVVLFVIVSIYSSTATPQKFSVNDSLVTNQTEREIAGENDLPIEPWMSNTHYWEQTAVADLQEETIEINKWMYDSGYWNDLSTLNTNENEEVLQIENWMTDTRYWETSVFKEKNTEPILEPEPWMQDKDFWD